MMNPPGTLTTRALRADTATDASELPVLHDVSCVIHVHSTYSDGTATVAELISSTAACGRDVLLLTDHDTLGARHDGWEGWHGDVLLGVGVEVSPDRGHYLAFGLDREIDHSELEEAEIPAAVRAAGGFGFAAHPFSRGSAMAARYRLTNRVGGKPHDWHGIEAEDLAGIELWSLTTDAAEAWRSPREAISYMRRPELALDGPPPHHLQTWDRLCARRRVSALAGLDAHQHGFRVRGRMYSPMPNERYFGLLSTYALLREPPSGDGADDLAGVYEALREGRSYLSVDAFADGHGFRFWGESEGASLLMGEEHSAAPCVLRVSAPQPGRIRLLRDGVEIATADSDTLQHAITGAGVYRAEVYLERHGAERPWIYSNPIYLR
ncbi:MAG: CehA/McbA family metallohydrolase [Solirubrobacterales bacterium]